MFVFRLFRFMKFIVFGVKYVVLFVVFNHQLEGYLYAITCRFEIPLQITIIFKSP